MPFRSFLVALLCLSAASPAILSQQSPCTNTLILPMTVEGNAPVVTLNFKRADGTMRPVRLVFDSGGGAMILDESLANDLGLKPTGKAVTDGGMSYSPTDPPMAYIGSWPVALSTSKAFIHQGKESFDTRERVEGLLPGKALELYQVVLDYPHGLFSIAPAGCVPHRGVKIPSPFLSSSGHPRIEVSVDDENYGLLLDTGSRVTLARRDVLESLSAAHPAWPHATGASGTADMPDGNGKEFLLRVPEVTWGPFQLRNVLFVSRPNETYSPDTFETPAPIAGALGGNVLKNFRVEIDYPHGATYLEQEDGDFDEDMNSAGLVLDVDAASNLVVRAISSTAAALTKRNVRPGDQILAIDGKRETPWKIIDASQALSGAVGESKRLLIKREGIEVQTIVVVADVL
jgi:hypothetical protein